jgi:hypothetical protein
MQSTARQSGKHALQLLLFTFKKSAMATAAKAAICCFNVSTKAASLDDKCWKLPAAVAAVVG